MKNKMKILLVTIIALLFVATAIYSLIGCGDTQIQSSTPIADSKSVGSTQRGIYVIWHDAEGWTSGVFYSNTITYFNDTLRIKGEPTIKIANNGGDNYITHFEILPTE